MERVEYDPEIDPSIREEREAAERERELVSRIRLEIERYVADNDLVPRDQKETLNEHNVDEGSDTDAAEPAETARERKQREKADKAEMRTARAKERRRAIGSVFTGSILSSEWVRKMWPYLLAVAALLVLYIAHTFQIQKLHLEHQTLERRVRELGIRSVAKTAERVRETRRSAIVDKLAEKNIPLEEFPYPVKTIER